MGARVGLGIDAGGSATRWVLRRDGDEQPLASGEAGPASGHLFNSAVRERSLASFGQLIADVGRVARPDCIAAGVTGLGAGTPPALTYAAILSEGLGTPPEAIGIGDDMWIAYRSLFAPGEGGLVYAGTGSVGYAIGVDGLALKVGGYGILIDDAGSGFWIAREAIRRVLRARDENPDVRSVLADLLYERIGGSGWPVIREAVYGGDRGVIAALAPVVARAADAGDTEAAAILAEAGVELARIGAILGRRGGFSQVALMGGAAALHAEIFASFVVALPPEMTGRLARANVADMAAQLALAGVAPPPNS